MDAKEYLKACLKTETVDFTPVQERLQDTGNIRLLHAAIGLCTETGEFQDALKKAIFYGKTLDRTNLVEELGDIMWYVAIATDELGVTLEEVMDKNAEKLAARYKDGFTEKQALERNLKEERDILEKK